MLLTCDRFAYAAQTVASFAENARYSGKLLLHIADDGSAPGHTDGLVELAERARFEGITLSNSEGHGYGANYNLATQTAHTLGEIILPLEDDWELLREFNFDLLVEALTTGPYGCIRLGYIGYTQELRASFVALGGRQYLHLDPQSPEPHVWSGNPRLETVEWERKVGPWPENADPGSTEFAVAHRAHAREGVLWPVELVKPSGDLFGHIGTVQAGAHQSALSEAVTIESER